MTGSVVHDFQGNAPFICTGRNGDIEHERIVGKLLVGAEAVNERRSAGSRSKTAVQDSGRGADGEVAGKRHGAVGSREGDGIDLPVAREGELQQGSDMTEGDIVAPGCQRCVHRHGGRVKSIGHVVLRGGETDLIALAGNAAVQEIVRSRKIGQPECRSGGGIVVTTGERRGRGTVQGNHIGSAPEHRI